MNSNEERTYTSSVFNVSDISKNYNNCNLKRVYVKRPEKNKSMQPSSFNMDTWNSMKPTLPPPQVYIMSKKRNENETAQVPNNQLTPHSKLRDINNWIDLSDSATDNVKSHNMLKNMQNLSTDACYFNILLNKKFDDEGNNFLRRFFEPSKIDYVKKMPNVSVHKALVPEVKHFKQPVFQQKFKNFSIYDNKIEQNTNQSNLTDVYNARYETSAKNETKNLINIKAKVEQKINLSNRTEVYTAKYELRTTDDANKNLTNLMKNESNYVNNKNESKLNVTNISEIYNNRYQTKVNDKDKEAVVVISENKFRNVAVTGQKPIVEKKQKIPIISESYSNIYGLYDPNYENKPISRNSKVDESIIQKTTDISECQQSYSGFSCLAKNVKLKYTKCESSATKALINYPGILFNV